MENKHDLTFYNVMKEENSIVSFLDAVFGFLFRCTDFYHGQTGSNTIAEVPLNMAHDLVLGTFKKYQLQAGHEEASFHYNLATSESEVPAACQEVVLETAEDPGQEAQFVIEEITELNESMDKNEYLYNGDDRGDYRWSQSLNDLDVTIPTPKAINKASQVKVEIGVLSLKVKLQKEEGWEESLDKSFPHSIIPQDSYWSLEAGSHLQINLEKKDKQWWDRLFLCDPSIDLKKIDTSELERQLTVHDRWKIQEVVSNSEDESAPV